MKELNFEAMREELSRKEELYEGFKWLWSSIASVAKWDLPTGDEDETRNKDNNEISSLNFIEEEWGAWNNNRGKLEAFKAFEGWIDKEIKKI